MLLLTTLFIPLTNTALNRLGFGMLPYAWEQPYFIGYSLITFVDLNIWLQWPQIVQSVSAEGRN